MIDPISSIVGMLAYLQVLRLTKRVTALEKELQDRQIKETLERLSSPPASKERTDV